MRVFVTGATGFIGAHIRQGLAERGIEYLGLSRIPNHHENFVQGDLLQPDSYREALKSCDMLIHAAGEVSHRLEDAEKIWKTHVDGSKLLYASAKQCNIKRVIHLSSSGTTAVSTEPQPYGTEKSPSPLPLIKEWPYYRAKYFTEQIAMQSGLDVICLNPSLTLGPSVESTNRANQSIRLFLDGQIPIAPAGGLSFTDVRDVAQTAIDALTDGQVGNKYLLGSCNLSFYDFYRKVARLANQPEPWAALPRRSHSILKLFPKWQHIGQNFGFDLAREELILASHFWYIDTSKASHQLAWKPRDPLATLTDAVSQILAEQQNFIGWDE